MAQADWTLDLGGAPWNEDCAQIGHTPNFDLVNTAEAMLYRAALIAVAGSPPVGISLRIKANAHDFGTYRTVEASIDNDQDDGSHASYLASPQGLFARQRFLGHKRNMGYATRFNRAIGSLSGWNSPAGSRLACSQR